MKAYCLSIAGDEDARSAIVFADTVGAAKKKVYDHESLTDLLEEWIWLRARRAKEYDGMENLTPAQLANKQWRNGWQWLGCDYPYPDEATDEEFYEWYEREFGK